MTILRWPKRQKTRAVAEGLAADVVTLVASLFGSSSHLINGLTNAISLVVFSALIGFDARFDAALVFVTAFAAIFIGVEHSILIGVALSLLLFVPRASKLGIRELIVTPERVVRERQPDEPRSNSLLIYDLEGELFFGAAPELDRYLEQIRVETVRTGIKYVVLRLRRTRTPDVVAVEHLERFLRNADQRDVTVLLAGVRPNLEKILRNTRFNEWLPADRIFPEKDGDYSATLDAVRHACQLLNQKSKTDGNEAVYYLV
ncbi:MAG TPA: STAS domain-containing protein [Chthoniobacterales bacterium]